MIKPDTDFYRAWFKRRLAVADAIVQEHGEAFAADAEILLCCAISGLAARAWPRKSSKESIDKARFTQLLVDFAPAQADMKRISVPTLRARLLAEEDGASAEALEGAYYPEDDSQIMTGSNLDQDDSAIMGLLPSLSRKLIRECSYASIMYVDLRNGLVHEYTLAAHLVGFAVSQRTTGPSYVKVTNFETKSTEQLLHFPYAWVRAVLASTAEALFSSWETADCEELPRPEHWWIQG